MVQDSGMVTLTINRGFSGSGKSTATNKLLNKNTVAINRDYLRMMTAGKWWPADEQYISDIQQASVKLAIARGLNVIVDDTFVEDKYVEQMRLLAAKLGVQFVINDSFLSVPVDKCIERDAARERSVGKDVIEHQYYRYWEQQPKPTNEGALAIIVDVDGTLAHAPSANVNGFHKGKYPYGRDKMDDRIDFGVLALVDSMSASGFQVLVVTGRGDKDRKVTEDWLLKYHVPYDKLFTRAAGDDTRSDVLVKKDIYIDYIQGKYLVRFVLDDRPAVVRMWRGELGLKVLQVAPNIEF